MLSSIRLNCARLSRFKTHLSRSVLPSQLIPNNKCQTSTQTDSMKKVSLGQRSMPLVKSKRHRKILSTRKASLECSNTRATSPSSKTRSLRRLLKQRDVNTSGQITRVTSIPSRKTFRRRRKRTRAHHSRCSTRSTSLSSASKSRSSN